MEEELLKRNTDCVYFLASPFTCKKGAECEYRHSDMARLNPRDCWYWLSGNCVNPTCAFRHPPLEVHTEASSEAAASLPSQSSVPAIKTTVPCYFYFNGFCNKGIRCPFLHEPNDAYTWKQKMANTIADAPVQPLDTKITGRTDTEAAPAKEPPIASEMVLKSGNSLQVQQKLKVQLPASSNMQELNPSTQANFFQDEETIAVKTVSLEPAEGIAKSEGEPSSGSDQSSEELINDNTVRDEWWESSPGFDVLVDGRTEDMADEDDSEYLHALARNDRDPECLFMQHGYADQNDYDERVFFRNGRFDASEHSDDEYRADHGRFSPRHASDRKVGRDVSKKRKLLSVDFPGASHNSVDLRDYLRNRRTVGSYLEAHALRHDLARRRDERLDRRQRRASNQHSHRRAASRVERDGVGMARRRTSVVDAHHQGRPRYPRRNRSREYHGMRRRQSSAERQQRSLPMRERDTQDSITFSGPKSLAELRGKKRAGHSIKNGSVDFDGPKPLSEILKEKKKTTSGDSNLF